MPNLKVHTKSSKERTGNTHEELHKWMDEGQAFLGTDHRFERHSTSYISYVKEKWGKEGILEFLQHIIEDYQDTLKKYSGKCEKCGADTWKGKRLCYACFKKSKKE